MSRWSTDPDVEDEIRSYVALGMTPGQALRRMTADSRYRDRLPSLRTAQRIVSQIAPTGERWSFATASPDEARWVLPVIAALGANALSRETAGWIARVRRAVPGLPPDDAFRWAIRYQAAAASGRDTAALDARFARETTR